MHPLQQRRGQPRTHTSPLHTPPTPQKQIQHTITRTPLDTPRRSLQLPARRRGDPEHTHLTPTHTITQPWWVGRGRPSFESRGGSSRRRRCSPRRPAGDKLLLLPLTPLVPHVAVGTPTLICTPPLLLPRTSNGARCAGPVGTTCPDSTLSVLHPFLPPPLCSSPSPTGPATVGTRPLDAGRLTQAEEAMRRTESEARQQ